MGLVFQDSMAETYVDPDLGWLRSRFVECAPEVWQHGSGSCALTLRQAGSPESRRGDALGSLEIVGRPGLGFLISHARPGRGTVTLVGDEDARERITVEIGGESIEPLRRYVADFDTAWQVVEHFVATGDPAPGPRWEADPDLGIPAQLGR